METGWKLQYVWYHISKTFEDFTTLSFVKKKKDLLHADIVYVCLCFFLPTLTLWHLVMGTFFFLMPDTLYYVSCSAYSYVFVETSNNKT